jgi:hypothetical protein
MESLTFGPTNVPVGLYPATTDKRAAARQRVGDSSEGVLIQRGD